LLSNGDLLDGAGMRGQELLTVIIYDVTSDRIRLKIADVCKDYGLDHVQYSVFSGPLDATRRNEMFARLGDTLGDNEGKVMMLQLCEKDAAAKREIVQIETTDKH
jgi:CRISPR-associated protein Cas2